MDFEKLKQWIRQAGEIADELVKLALKVGTLVGVIKATKLLIKFAPGNPRLEEMLMAYGGDGARQEEDKGEGGGRKVLQKSA